MKPSVTILGIDPGLANLGYGVIQSDGLSATVVDYGAFVTLPDQPMAQRLLSLFDALRELMALRQPDFVAIETLYFAKNTKTAMAVAQARGVALAAVARGRAEVREVTPLQIKLALTGYGRADKKQIQRMTQTLLGLDELPRPDHAADALAAALTCSHGLRRR